MSDLGIEPNVLVELAHFFYVLVAGTGYLRCRYCETEHDFPVDSHRETLQFHYDHYHNPDVLKGSFPSQDHRPERLEEFPRVSSSGWDWM